MPLKWLLIVPCLLLTGCMPPPLQGPEADLAAIATPDPLPAKVIMPPKPAPGPPAPPGFFRAWIPRHTSAHGDSIDGHFATISTTPPAVQVAEPVHTIPRPPRAKAPKPKPPTLQVPVSQLPPGLLPPGTQPEGDR